MIDYYLEILNNIKEIKCLGDSEFMTVQMVADYFEVGYETINSLIKDNKEELKSNGLKLYKRKEIREMFDNIQTGRGRDVVTIGDIQFNVTNTGVRLISKKVLLNIGMLLYDNKISIELKKSLNLGKRTSSRKEVDFLNQLEQALKPFDIKGEKQYHILSYRIDYYIPSLNIAIEYDENDHSNYTYEAHEGRQEEVEKELGCKFIRVSDKNSNEYNIGYVIKNIFNL